MCIETLRLRTHRCVPTHYGARIGARELWFVRLCCPRVVGRVRARGIRVGRSAYTPRRASSRHIIFIADPHPAQTGSVHACTTDLRLKRQRRWRGGLPLVGTALAVARDATCSECECASGPPACAEYGWRGAQDVVRGARPSRGASVSCRFLGGGGKKDAHEQGSLAATASPHR